MIFCREDISNSLVMIQPSLICYSFQAPPQPVLLDATSVRPDVMLLLDTFFHVLIFHGETIASWRDQGFADMPEHAAFRQLLEAPKEDAASIMEKRMPVPRYIVCDQHKSQARFLMAKLNPSVTHNNADQGSGVAPVFTDDVVSTGCSIRCSDRSVLQLLQRTFVLRKKERTCLNQRPTRRPTHPRVQSYSVFSEHLCKLAVQS